MEEFFHIVGLVVVFAPAIAIFVHDVLLRDYLPQGNPTADPIVTYPGERDW